MEIQKKHFDSLVDRYIKQNRPLSDRRLTKLSHNCSKMHEKFNSEESRLICDIDLRRTVH